jgi:hypothetical protein
MRKTFTLADTGRALAIDMLCEIHELGADELALDHVYRDGRPQSDVVVRHLQRARAAGAVAERAFLAVITDALGAAIETSLPDPEYYDHAEAAVLALAA